MEKNTQVRIPITGTSGLTRKSMSPLRNRRRRERDSWLSNELSNMMEVSILFYRKVYGTTAEYYISLFKTIIDATKDLEEWIAVKIQ